MSTSGEANWASMAQLAEQIGGRDGGGIAGEISTQLQQLQSTLETLAPQWQSEAATTFYNVNQQWQENANAVNRALMDISNGLHETASRYQQMTAEATDTVRQAGQTS